MARRPSSTRLAIYPAIYTTVVERHIKNSARTPDPTLSYDFSGSPRQFRLVDGETFVIATQGLELSLTPQIPGFRAPCCEGKADYDANVCLPPPSAHRVGQNGRGGIISTDICLSEDGLSSSWARNPANDLYLTVPTRARWLKLRRWRDLVPGYPYASSLTRRRSN